MTEEEKNTEKEKVETPEAAESQPSGEPQGAEPPPAGETKAAGEADGKAAEKQAEKPAEPAEPAEPDWKDLYARLLADFDNYKKRAAREREQLYGSVLADVLAEFLPVVDNLQLALANAGEKAEDPFVKGVQLVHDTLLKTLKEHGAEPFDSVGQALDTERMEAIATLPSEEVEEGKVSLESKKGWMLKEKVLRAAQVVVSAGPAEAK